MLNNSKFFKEKVVLLYLINDSPDFGGGIAICDPKIEEANGRVFVVGTVPVMLSDWSSGQKAGVAFDQIAHFVAFASEQEFVERSASWNPTVC